MTNQTPTWKPKVFPPQLFFLAIGLILLAGWYENGELITRSWPLLLSALGVWLAVREKNRFVRRGTTFYPGKTAEQLITDGAYRFTRNPMYLGMVLALIGLGGAAGTWMSAPLILAFAAAIYHGFILKEEAMLEQIFGDDYRAYKQTVRRWL